MAGQSLQQKILSNGCFASLACSIGSISVAFSSLSQIPNTTDRISLQRGLFLTSMGFIYFISLTDFCNKYLMETKHGQHFRKKYRLMISDVLEITNKIVSAIQAFFSFLVGVIVCKSTCSKSFVYASHFLMEAYSWFGTAYFIYDIWAMYKGHSQMLADKLKLISITKKFDVSKRSLPLNGNGQFKKGKLNGSAITKLNGNLSVNGNDQIGDNQSHNGKFTKEPKSLKFTNDVCEEAFFSNEVEATQSPGDFFKYIITNPVMMIHHIFIGTFGFLVVTYIRGGGHCIYSYMFMMEFSTPFVSLRSILSTMGLKESRTYIINGLSMVVAFFICRVLMWPYVLWRYSIVIDATFLEALSTLPRGCIISILILFLPQIYWFYLMVRGALKVFFPKTKLQKHSSEVVEIEESSEDELLALKNNNLLLAEEIKQNNIEHQVPVN